jgi:hypothetical protein
VAQISTATPDFVEVGDIFSLLINGQVMATFTATAGNTANVTAGLSAAWQAEKATDDYSVWMDDITATDSGPGTNITLTAGTKGLPFTVTATAVNGGAADTQTLTMATPTAATGPHHWDDANNWSTGAVPVNADDVYIQDNNVSILWGLGQSGVVLDSLNIDQTYTGLIGLDRRTFCTSADGTSSSTEKEEYRATYLDIGWITAIIGERRGTGPAVGSGRLKLDNARADVSYTHITNTASQSADTPLPAIRLLFANSLCQIFISGGSGGVGIAADSPVETTNTAQIVISSSATSSRLFLGEGSTATNYVQSAGTTEAASLTLGGTTRVNGGMMILQLLCDLTTLDIYGGTVLAKNYSDGIPITTLNLYGGTVDFTGLARSRTVTNLNLIRGGGTLKYDSALVTFTNITDPASGVVSLSYDIEQA